ncbi:glutamate receptor ionotropic, kainate 5-like [Anoplophora glabripennis]|uniref:glutamate receptor ionotropic, kainate 5-like n=1 Tax=Anoplophora glabripennis TaxID=217634 RepID=UPI000C7725BD|nr:glutamate receptor ionotropic, kainate 5-like [Anoplophora glabripennis]
MTTVLKIHLGGYHILIITKLLCIPGSKKVFSGGEDDIQAIHYLYGGSDRNYTSCNYTICTKPNNNNGHTYPQKPQREFFVDAPYRSAINKAILKLHESGRLNDLKNKWWKENRNEPSCENFDTEEESNSGQLTLADTCDVFYLLGVGIVIAIILATIEFLWNVRNVSAEEHITYGEALKMELKFACKVWITKKRTKQESLSAPLSAVQEKQ